MSKDIKKIQTLIGKATKNQLRYVDYYLGRKVGLFIPSVGPCFFARTPMHVHPSYLFIMAFDDNCILKIEGKEAHLAHGKVCSISPDVPHHEYMQGDFSRYIAIIIDKSFFEKQLKFYSVKKIPVFLGDVFPTPAELIFYLKDFMIESENKMPGHESLLEALSYSIAHILIRNIFDFKPKIERSTFRIKINKAIDYIYANYGKKITVEDMANNVAMSVSHFSRLFKEETGKTPNDYLADVRLFQAQKLLRAGDKTLTQIAYDCGFGSSAYFSTCFYKKFKVLPSKYRKNFKIKHNS